MSFHDPVFLGTSCNYHPDLDVMVKTYDDGKAQVKTLFPGDGPPLRVCDHCQKLFPLERLTTGPDPFLQDVHGDTEIITVCDDCYQVRLDSI